jgi:heme/copper-type cytochrome/quinol oxidase subunit 2
VRAFLTSFMTLFLSFLVGGIIAQQLAVATGAREEYILVFIAVILLGLVFALVFFIAQFARNARQAVDATARWSLAIFFVLVVALLGFEYWAVAGDMAKFKADLPIIAGLTLPGLAIILVDWLFVRWRVGAPHLEVGGN